MPDIDTSFYPRANQTNPLQAIVGGLEARNLLVQNQRQQVGLSQDKVNLAHQQYGILSGVLGSLAQDPRISTEEGPGMLQSATSQLVKDGIIPPALAQQELAQMPSDPKQLPQYLQTLNTRVLDGQAKFSQIYGSPSTLSNGSETQPVTVSPITGIRPIGAPFAQTLSPAERSSLVTTTDNQGRTVLVPKANVLQQAGVNPMTAVPETAPNQPVNQLVPYGAANPAPVPAGSAGQSNQPMGGVIASPPAGTIDAQKTMAVAGTQQLAQDVARERNFTQDMIPLVKAREALQQLGPTGSGPGTEQLNEMKSFLVSMGVLGPDDSVKNFDEAKKYLVQFARASGDVGTNDKLAAAFSGNPSTGISNAAAVDVLKTATATRRLQNAQVRLFQQSGDNPAQYATWSTEFNASQDPVAYGFDMMSPVARQKYYAGLSKNGKAKFLQSLQNATNLGLVAPPPANGG